MLSCSSLLAKQLIQRLSYNSLFYQYLEAKNVSKIPMSNFSLYNYPQTYQKPLTMAFSIFILSVSILLLYLQLSKKKKFVIKKITLL